jgi:hypothetical protein
VTLGVIGSPTGRAGAAVTILVLVGLCAIPAVVFVGFERSLTWFCNYNGRSSRAEPDPEAVLDDCRQSLRRLSREHAMVLVAEHLPAKVSRLRALELAYDDTLARACRALQIEDSTSPIRGAARAQTEAELMVRGFTW